MPTKITLTLPDVLDDKQQYMLRNLLLDAFAEFATRRSPPELYVINRYPAGGEYDWLNRAEKIQEVTTRVGLAQGLHQATFDATYEVIK